MTFSAIIHAMTFDGQDTLSLPEACATLRECGFEGVMLMSIPGRPALTEGNIPDACLLDLAQSDLGIVKRIVADAGLEIIGLYCAGIDPSSDATFETSVGHLRDGARVAVELGCRHLGHGGGRAPNPGLAVEAKLPLVQRLARIVDAVAAEFPETLFAVDAHYHGVIESTDDCERYIAELSSDRGGILLNTGHMTTCGQAGGELIERHPDRVPVIGWKDHRPDPAGKRPFLSVELGTGETELERYVRAALDHPADRVHVINVEHVPMQEKAQALRASLQHLRELRG
ncbi:MAG: sugar phosphate isomerase/epimerase [candidate division WS1 bacterium]|jgi:sugar phosphate isomerase/epimerase|nr:sugar phosphate isomerase/epimerase [candidate division WS1 bacterium]